MATAQSNGHTNGQGFAVPIESRSRSPWWSCVRKRRSSAVASRIVWAQRSYGPSGNDGWGNMARTMSVRARRAVASAVPVVATSAMAGSSLLAAGPGDPACWIEGSSAAPGVQGESLLWRASPPGALLRETRTR